MATKKPPQGCSAVAPVLTLRTRMRFAKRELRQTTYERKLKPA